MTPQEYFVGFIQWFSPAAPSQSVPDSAIIPEATNNLGMGVTGGWDDPLGPSLDRYMTMQPVHSKTAGYLPSWGFVPPPGFGDAPQHVWSTFTLVPLSVDGPGDRPATYFRDFLPPVIANFAMRWQGMPVDGGSILMTGLYTPQPLQSMSNDIFSGSGV